MKRIPNKELQQRGIAIQAFGMITLLVGLFLARISILLSERIGSPSAILMGVCLIGAIFGCFLFLKRGGKLYKKGKEGLTEGETPPPEPLLLTLTKILASLLSALCAWYYLLLLFSPPKNPDTALGENFGTLLLLAIWITLFYLVLPKYTSLSKTILVRSVLAVLPVLLLAALSATPLIQNKKNKQEIQDTLPQIEKGGAPDYYTLTNHKDETQTLDIPSIGQSLKIPKGWEMKTEKRGEKHIFLLLKTNHPPPIPPEVILTYQPIPNSLAKQAHGNPQSLLTQVAQTMIKTFEKNGAETLKSPKPLGNQEVLFFSTSTKPPTPKNKTLTHTFFIFQKNSQIITLELVREKNEKISSNKDFETITKSIKP